MPLDFPKYNATSHQILTTDYRNFLASFSDGMWNAGFKHGPCVSYAFFGLLLGTGYDLSCINDARHEAMRKFLFEFTQEGALSNKSLWGSVTCNFEHAAGYRSQTLFQLLSKHNIFEVDRVPQMIPKDSELHIWEEYFNQLQENQVHYFYMVGRITEGGHAMSFQYLRKASGGHYFRWFQQNGSNLLGKQPVGIRYFLNTIDSVGAYRKNNLYLYNANVGIF